MGNQANNPAIAQRYEVRYDVYRPTGVTRDAQTVCAVIDDYSTFEDIRKMVAIREGVSVADIIVVCALLQR